MKNFIYLFILIALSSCATELKVIYPEETFYNIDFTPFTEKGFLITPEKYEGKYESIGMIDFIAKPGAKFEKSYQDFYTSTTGITTFKDVYKWKTDMIIFSDVLNKVYEQCTKMGADALINFRNEITEDRYTNILNPVTILGYRITGFAIKRKTE
jgi:hypothetical protein